MEHPYHHKLPELSELPLSRIYFEEKRFHTFEAEDQFYILTYVFGKLALAFGGFHHFWANEEDKVFVIEGWKFGLSDIYPRTLFNGLYSILTMRTEYSKYPPRSGQEFYKVCVGTNLPYIPDPNILLLEQPQTTEEEVIASIRKLYPFDRAEALIKARSERKNFGVV